MTVKTLLQLEKELNDKFGVETTTTIKDGILNVFFYVRETVENEWSSKYRFAFEIKSTKENTYLKLTLNPRLTNRDLEEVLKVIMKNCFSVLLNENQERYLKPVNNMYFRGDTPIARIEEVAKSKALILNFNALGNYVLDKPHFNTGELSAIILDFFKGDE